MKLLLASAFAAGTIVFCIAPAKAEFNFTNCPAPHELWGGDDRVPKTFSQEKFAPTYPKKGVQYYELAFHVSAVGGGRKDVKDREENHESCVVLRNRRH